MKLVWVTDPHLNFLPVEKRKAFYAKLMGFDRCNDAIAISGDICGGSNEIYLFKELKALRIPVYFVLGNHDYYGGSVADMRRSMKEVATNDLYYLSNCGVIELSPTTALIGHDGWADGGFGNFAATGVMLNDHSLISDLATFCRYDYVLKEPLSVVMKKFAQESADHIEWCLDEAVRKYKQIFIVTHIPPFREACWYMGKISNDDFLPYFACKVVGEAIKEVAENHPDVKITVLCGHTHSSGEVNILDNLEVLTGAANYGNPTVQRIFEF